MQAMELRKICNHPFLCDGLEADLVAKHSIVTVSNFDIVEQYSSIADVYYSS